MNSGLNEPPWLTALGIGVAVLGGLILMKAAGTPGPKKSSGGGGMFGGGGMMGLPF